MSLDVGYNSPVQFKAGFVSVGFISVGFIKSENQFLLREKSPQEQSTLDKVLDTIEIKQAPLSVMLYSSEETISGLEKLLEEEGKYYPIVDASSLNLDAQSFSDLSAEDLGRLQEKLLSRWVLKNNLETIEQIYPNTLYFKDLWSSERSSFFEELWFFLKRNLATSELTLIFHDAKETIDSKNEKPTLIYSYVTGKKRPQIFEGEQKEEAVMLAYKNEFNEDLQITEYNQEQGKLVACVRIGRSPILIMATLNGLNQLQQSLLKSLFIGLKESH